MFSILLALVAALGFSLVTAAPVLAGTIRNVPDDYPTIQAAIDAAGPGDTVMVAAGDYDAFVVEAKANISIISTEGATVTTAGYFWIGVEPIQDAWVMAAVHFSENINIEGINFDGTGVKGREVFVGIAYVDSTGRIAHLSVENIIATDLGAGVAIIGAMGTSTVEMTGATISNNDRTGIYVCGGSTLEAHFNKIVGNSECGLLNDGGGMVDAIRNWWGHASGPLHLTNLLGRGDAIIGNVDFEPWLGGEVVIKTVTDDIVDARDQADTEVVVTGTATVIVARYEDNPGGPPPTGSSSLSSLHKYIDVYVPDTTEVTELETKLYYTDAEVAAADIDKEESLRLFWSNGTAWAECSDSGVNTAGNYIWAKIRGDTTPTLSHLTGTPFGGYGHPSETPQPCCMATVAAASGTNAANELDTLREFRDEVLLPNSLGAGFVSLYYKTSPPVADFISQQEILRTAVRVYFVEPIVAILNWSHDLWSARASQ
jgi:hypothetical protein